MVKPVYPLQLCCGGYNKTAIEQRGEAWAHKTSLTQSLFIDVPVPSLEREQLYTCDRGIDFVSVLCCFDQIYGTVPTIWYFFWLSFYYLNLMIFIHPYVIQIKYFLYLSF
jgi:hypothetical protein